MPLSDSPNSDDEDWGVVAELPNTRLGNGKAKLAQLAGQPIELPDISECGTKDIVEELYTQATPTMFSKYIPLGGFADLESISCGGIWLGRWLHTAVLEQ